MRKLTIQSRGMVFLLASFAGMAPMSWDITLAAMPVMARDFSTSPAYVQLTLSLFAIGFGLGQLVYGPMSDRYGRKPVLLGGFALYVLSSVGCAVAGGMDQLIALRFLQGFAGSVGVVLSRAIVRDLYERQEGARMLSLMTMIQSLAPIIAPLLGGFLVVHFGWPSIFVVLAVLGAGATTGAALLLGESLKHKDLHAIAPRRIAANWLRFFTNRRSLAFAAVNALTYAGVFSYIAGSSFVYLEIYNVPTQDFGYYFMVTAVGLMAGSSMNARLVRRMSTDRIMLAGFAMMFVASILALIELVTHYGGPIALVLPMVLYAFAMAWVMPNAVAATMEPMPEIAGSVSSLLGFLQMMAGALTGYLVNLFFWPTHGIAMAGSVLFCCIASGGIYILVARRPVGQGALPS
jgi:DHA1 family bicyclomycin/chloramphenicol resistance-like MFS transporter